MDSARWQGANHSDASWHGEDLQRRHRVEDALSCFDISVSACWGILGAATFAREFMGPALAPGGQLVAHRIVTAPEGGAATARSAATSR
jgi:hypothetical protein